MKIHNLVSGQVKKHVTSVSSSLEPDIRSCDTGQQMPCFDSCQLSMKCITNMKVNQGERATLVNHLVNRQLSNGRHVVRLRAPTPCAREQMPPTKMTIRKEMHGFPISMHGFLWFVHFL